MNNEIRFEWACEYLSDDDIIDTDFSDKKIDVWPARWSHIELGSECKPVISVRRYVGNEEDGILDIGYAYQGDTTFDTGHKIPAYLLNQLNKGK